MDENPASRAARTCATISGTRSARLKPSGNCVLMNRPTFMTGFSSACGAQLTLDTLALNSVGHWPGSPARIVQYYYCTILKLSIAVLPFANLSGDPEQEYFAG